jgi:hypothetical protein
MTGERDSFSLDCYLVHCLQQWRAVQHDSRLEPGRVRNVISIVIPIRNGGTLRQAGGQT